MLTRSTDADIALIEVGGTVGDIESQPFLEAIRELRNDLGRENTAFVHITWLPYLRATNETKTKPTQHSVRELRSLGILPDMIIARSDFPVEKELAHKISQFCDVREDAVIPLVTADLLYEIPLVLEQAQVADFLLERLKLEPKQPTKIQGWKTMVAELKRQKPSIKIGLVGKYVELHDAYLSVREALNHAALFYGVDVDLQWISSTAIEKDNVQDLLVGLDGILVPGGFGSRGVEGKILAAQYARENHIPYLGLCLGLQVMMIDFARNVLGLKNADSAEFDKLTPDPVIDLMLEQRGLVQMGGTMRLGLYPCNIKPGSRAEALYQAEVIQERHRHRYEFNNEYRQKYEENGMVFSGVSPDGVLVEMAELEGHPFMMASQFHPEFLSRPNRAHPLFLGFIQAACKKAGFSDQPVKLDFTN